jgi:hypothetical protein
MPIIPALAAVVSPRPTGADVDAHPLASFVAELPIDPYSWPTSAGLDTGAAVIRATAASIKLVMQAQQLQMYIEQSPPKGLDALQSIIAGEVLQTQLLEINNEQSWNSLATGCVELLHEIALDALRKHGFHKLAAKGKWTGAKMLIAEPGQGDQPIHFDSPLWDNAASDSCVVTVLLYVSDCAGPKLPRYDCNRFLTNTPHFSEAMQRDARLLLGDCFVTVDARAGDMVLFTHNTPHAGSACSPNSKVNRAVLFDMITLKPKAIDAEAQYFCWAFMRDAFGNDSLPYRHCLRQNIQHSPVEREDKASNEEKADLREFIGVNPDGSLD